MPGGKNVIVYSLIQRLRKERRLTFASPFGRGGGAADGEGEKTKWI